MCFFSFFFSICYRKKFSNVLKSQTNSFFLLYFSISSVFLSYYDLISSRKCILNLVFFFLNEIHFFCHPKRNNEDWRKRVLEFSDWHATEWRLCGCIHGQSVATSFSNLLSPYYTYFETIFYLIKTIFKSKLGETAMENRDSILFPQEANEGKITSFAFVKDYLIYTTDVNINYIEFSLVFKL